MQMQRDNYRLDHRSILMESPSPGGGLGYIEHTVTKFDTLAGVAIKYGVEVKKKKLFFKL